MSDFLLRKRAGEITYKCLRAGKSFEKSTLYLTEYTQPAEVTCMVVVTTRFLVLWVYVYLFMLREFLMVIKPNSVWHELLHLSAALINARQVASIMNMY